MADIDNGEHLVDETKNTLSEQPIDTKENPIANDAISNTNEKNNVPATPISSTAPQNEIASNEKDAVVDIIDETNEKTDIIPTSEKEKEILDNKESILPLDETTTSESNTKEEKTETDNNITDDEIEEVSNDEDEQPINYQLTEEDIEKIETLVKDEELFTEEEEQTETVIVNDNDSQELADEVGISGVFDEYDREILEPVFENKLRMSINSIKLAYSKTKNTILSYKDMKQQFVDNYEIFSNKKKVLFRIEIGSDSVLLYCAIDPSSIDKEIYGHFQANGADYEKTPTKVFIKKERVRAETSSIQKSLALIEKVMEIEELPKLKVYVPIAYAERYPFNPQAVLRGNENKEPEPNAYDSEEYDQIESEISLNIIEELMGPDNDVNKKKGQEKLDALRQQATTIKSAIAITEPIVYFYDSALNSDNSIAYVNTQQVLNDKFMGKILPQQYFAIAESSERITELNLIALKQVVSDCNEYSHLTFAVQISCRILSKQASLNKLLKAVVTENNNLILAMDCTTLEALGPIGLDAVNKLKQLNVKIMLDNTENAGLKILTEYDFDYLRFDTRYYREDSTSTIAHLDMLTGYAKVQGITTTSCYVETSKMARFFQAHGVTVIQGPAVCMPSRKIYNAVKDVKKLAIMN
jgi:EAL domain-containing protein (putative c-di-GMP-specific phosphodiesterase class I)